MARRDFPHSHRSWRGQTGAKSAEVRQGHKGYQCSAPQHATRCDQGSAHESQRQVLRLLPRLWQNWKRSNAPCISVAYVPQTADCTSKTRACDQQNMKWRIRLCQAVRNKRFKEVLLRHFHEVVVSSFFQSSQGLAFEGTTMALGQVSTPKCASCWLERGNLRHKSSQRCLVLDGSHFSWGKAQPAKNPRNHFDPISLCHSLPCCTSLPLYLSPLSLSVPLSLSLSFQFLTS